MTTTTSRQSARTRPIDHASANYDIALNLAANTGTVLHELCFHTRTPATATTLAGESPATRPATSTEITRAMVPHYGKPPCIPSYRDNHVPRLAMFGTPRHNTLRGPPGSSRRPRGAQQDASKRRDVEHRSYRRPADGTSTHDSGDGSPGSRRKRTEEKKGLGG